MKIFQELQISWPVARREIRNGIFGFRILIACLVLGVATITIIGSIKSGIEEGLKEEGALLLGGDAEAEFTYRFANPAELSWLESKSKKISEIVDFRSMVFVEGETNERALTQVKAVDKNYPLMGEVNLYSFETLSEALQKERGVPGAVIEQILVDRLGLTLGDTFKLGQTKFHLGGVIKSVPDSGSDGFGLGPRSIVYKDDLESSGLLSPGTLFSTKYRLDLKDTEDLDLLSKKASEKFEKTGMRWKDARNAAPGINEFVERLETFLVLVGLSGLIVGGVGIAASVRSYILLKTSTIATLRSIGASNSIIFQTYFIQIIIFSLLGILIGGCLGSIGPFLLGKWLTYSIPIPIKIGFYFKPILEAIIYGLLTSTAFSLWPLSSIENIKSSELFRNETETKFRLPRFKYLATILAIVLSLIILAAYFTGSIKLTLWTAFAIISSFLCLIFVAAAVRAGTQKIRIKLRRNPKLRWALSAITGPKEGAIIIILSIGIGLSVLSSIGQIGGNIRLAIQQDLPDVAPSYFFIDIQKSQMPEFRKIMEANKEVTAFDEAPMIRGIISRINGIPAKEFAGEHWVLSGDRGITYSTAPAERSKITEGIWWAPDYKGPAQVSFADEEGKEMGLSLGDELTVNIMGRDINATITSFRDVDFSTAGIGFIMSMNPHALQSAPHSFISTVYAKPKAEAQLLREVAGRFPNITAVRIKEAIAQVSTILTSISSVVLYGATTTILTGFLVLIGTAASTEKARKYEAAILKAIGASEASILFSFALRSILLGGVAGAIALAIGMIGAWAVCNYIMGAEYSIIWLNAFFVIVGGVLANVFASLYFSIRAMRASTSSVLRSEY